MTATVPTHRDAGPTEQAAAKRASKWAETLEARVLAAVVEAGDRGITAKEAREFLGLPIERQYSISPRLSALKKKGLVEPTQWSRGGFMAYAATVEGGRALRGAA